MEDLQDYTTEESKSLLPATTSCQEPRRRDGPRERLPSSRCWWPPYRSRADTHSYKGLCVMALSVHCFAELLLILWSSQSLHCLFLTVAGALERGWYKCPVKAEHSAVTSPSILTTRSLCLNCYPLQKDVFLTKALIYRYEHKYLESSLISYTFSKRTQ